MNMDMQFFKNNNTMITRPTLLLNKAICKANIQRMIKKAEKNNTILRPHFKTHQSAHIGSWFKETGIECITVSSVKMAEYFADNGWKDITIAFPANILEWNAINKLAEKININIMVESIESIEFLESKLRSPVGLYIKIDTGYGRSGIIADDFDAIQQLLRKLTDCKQLIFIGFLCHAGHTYHAKSKNEIHEIMTTSREQLLALKTFMASSFPLIQISYGDTPSCSIEEDLSEFDEIRPGCFVFYDEMQTALGASHKSNIAIALAVPVVAKHPERNEIIVHGGAVHLSKDCISNVNGESYFGTAVQLNGLEWDINKEIGQVKKLSQEHGVIQVNDETMSKINIGDVIAILPIHACLTANLMKNYLTTEGEEITMLI